MSETKKVGELTLADTGRKVLSYEYGDGSEANGTLEGVAHYWTTRLSGSPKQSTRLTIDGALLPSADLNAEITFE